MLNEIENLIKLSKAFLFLDFDGVTHPFFPRYDLGEDENRYFSFLPVIESVLREFPQVNVVISSSWRKNHPLDELKLHFAEDMRERVLGVTPEIALDSADWTGCRQREVELFLEQHDVVATPWVALDDDAPNFLPDAPLLLCMDKFDAQDAEKLRAMLNAITGRF